VEKLTIWDCGFPKVVVADTQFSGTSGPFSWLLSVSESPVRGRRKEGLDTSREEKVKETKRKNS
jgi:hypothetical protein